MKNKCHNEFENEIFGFAKKHGWDTVRGLRGSTGSFWIKDGRYRMISLEPKSYGWLIGISNMLFTDTDDETTCTIKRPVGEHRYDKHKLTHNFWKVTNQEEFIRFLRQ